MIFILKRDNPCPALPAVFTDYIGQASGTSEADSAICSGYHRSQGILGSGSRQVASSGAGSEAGGRGAGSAGSTGKAASVGVATSSDPHPAAAVEHLPHAGRLNRANPAPVPILLQNARQWAFS